MELNIMFEGMESCDKYIANYSFAFY